PVKPEGMLSVSHSASSLMNMRRTYPGRPPYPRPAATVTGSDTIVLDDRTSVHKYTNGLAGIIAALDGWKQLAQKDSHVQFKHPAKPGRVAVPHPRKDIPLGTLHSIEKQAGLKLT